MFDKLNASIEEQFFRDPWNQDRGLRPSPSTQVPSKVMGFTWSVLSRSCRARCLPWPLRAKERSGKGGEGAGKKNGELVLKASIVSHF